MRKKLVALIVSATLCALPAAVVAQSGNTVTNTTTGGASQTAPTTTVITFGGVPATVAPAAPGSTVQAGGAASLGGLLAVPGFFPAPNNFSQPYKPDTFVNGPKFLPDAMKLEQADACRNGKVKWYGTSQEQVVSITLYYAGVSQIPTTTVTMANYVGTATATGTDLPFLTVLCEAAYRAMKRGANVAMVNSTIRPKNTMVGIGFGGSAGGSGVPDVKSVNPYSFAGVLGFGTGWSSAKVEGEILVELTGLRGGLPVKTSQGTLQLQPVPVPVAPQESGLPESARQAIKADCGGQGQNFGACPGQ